MAKKAHGLSVSKPISVWNKPLQADFKQLFTSLSKAAVHGITGAWADAAEDAADALAAVGIETDPGQLAWLLIRRSLTKAMFDLVAENADLIQAADKELDKLSESLDLSLEESELRIDPSFFEHPKELSIVEDIKLPFKEWLVGAGVEVPKATAICSRLGNYFVFSLNEEWRNYPSRYAPIKESLDTPFTNAEQREQAWNQYNSWLVKQVNEPMFDEAFSLQQVYVPLRAYFEEKKEDQDREKEEYSLGRESGMRRVPIELKTDLESWLKNPSKEFAIRVISGGPGSGKSSFVKMFAADHAVAGDLKVLYLPLHLLDTSGNLEESIDEFVRINPYLPKKPLSLNSSGERLLLIFDGLDELAMQGKAAEEVAQNFIREVDKTVFQMNTISPRVQVLFSGRQTVVQYNASEFRIQGQVLHLLPYWVPSDEEEQFDDPNRLLRDDQRAQWWQKYGECVGEKFENLPDPLKRDDLNEVTAQPLLNYLLALSFARKKLDFSTGTNLNSVYEDLLSAVYERGWTGRQHTALQGISERDFGRILEEIAVAAWHGQGRTTTVSEIEKHCQSSGLQGLLKIFQEGAKAGVTRLLTAFYFRQSGQLNTGERTFEFTHKSFGEYLTAKRIVRVLEKMHRELMRRQEDPDDGWDERQALTNWISLIGPTVLDEYVFRFLCDELRLRGKKICDQWQLTISKLFGAMLRIGTPMEKLEPRLTFQEESRQARNSGEALLAALNACARVTNKISKVDWPSTEVFGEWIARISGQRVGPENVLVLNCMGLLDLSGCVLITRDFYRADMRGSDLQNAECTFIVLMGADLGKANLKNAELQMSNLFEADFFKADLSGADLQEATLSAANLSEANLSKADLTEADLSGADFSGANLNGADLGGVKLLGAKLLGANLREVKNLTQEQIDSAHCDERTKLPDNLKCNKPEKKSSK